MKFTFSKKTLMGCFLALGMLFNANAAKAEIIELALVLDGSGSVSSSDFTLQKNAYANIFSSNFVTNFVNPGDELWVTVWNFSSSVVMEIAATLIDTDAAATTFSTLFAGITQQGGLTNTGGAINDAAAALLTPDVQGDRLIIDISTDGVPTTGPNAITAATNANAAGVIINAIGVGGVDAGFLSSLTTAGGGFFVTADNFAEFQTSLEDKLLREIKNPDPVPSPATLGLLGLTLALFAYRKRVAK